MKELNEHIKEAEKNLNDLKNKFYMYAKTCKFNCTDEFSKAFFDMETLEPEYYSCSHRLRETTICCFTACPYMR